MTRRASESLEEENARWMAEDLAAKNAAIAAIPLSLLTDDPEILAEFDEKKGTNEMSDVNPFELSEPPVVQAPSPAPSPNNGRRKRAETAELESEVPVKPRRGGRPKGSKNKATLNAEGQPQPARRGRPPRVTDAAMEARIKAMATAPNSVVSLAMTQPTAAHDVKISLATAMDALFYLKEEDRALTSKFVQVLSGINKGSRERILAAVGKVFA